MPQQPDDVDEQKAFVAQVALTDRPDIVIFIPVDDVAMIEPVERLNAAGIPIVLASNVLPGRFVTFVGADDEEIGYRQAKHLFERGWAAAAGSSCSKVLRRRQSIARASPAIGALLRKRPTSRCSRQPSACSSRATASA